MSGNSHGNNASNPLVPPRRNNYTAYKSWPELVGLPAEEAKKKIKEEMIGATTPIVPENAYVTMDFRTDRVRLYVNDDGKVVRTPQIG